MSICTNLLHMCILLVLSLVRLLPNCFDFADAFVQIIRDEGVAALWNGTFPSLLLVLNPAIQFMIYEGLKRQLRRGIPREVSKKREVCRHCLVGNSVHMICSVALHVFPGLLNTTCFETFSDTTTAFVGMFIS